MDKQILDPVNRIQTSEKISRIVETVTCIECCKFYKNPETALCGHTLCHGCWSGQQACPICALPLDRPRLKSNESLKKITASVQTSVMQFEKFFKIKFDELMQSIPSKEVNVEKDAVKAWLANSQNKFSASILNSQESTQGTDHHLKVKECEIQIHSELKKSLSPMKVIRHVPPPPQDDWDKIEIVPDSEDLSSKDKENVGPTQMEQYFEDEYSTENPRRSSRKRDGPKEQPKEHESCTDKHNSSNLSVDTESKLNKAKQNWSNVKKMRKEFSKLHKKNKNKLNVSIEKCKKTQITNKAATVLPLEEQLPIRIDECTPDIDLHNKIDLENVHNTDSNAIGITTENNQSMEQNISCSDKYKDKSISDKTLKEQVHHNNSSSIPFLKKGALSLEQLHQSQGANIKTINNIINSHSVSTDSDDIQITIKIGSTLTNIFIKKKTTDVELKVNTDQEVQTSLCPDSPNLNNRDLSPKPQDVQNIQIDIGSQNEINARILQTNNSESNRKLTLSKSISTKKNTASADTVPFEITDSVEKELSKIMECGKSLNEKVTSIQNKGITKPTVISQSDAVKTVDMECDDLDIFASGSVKEANVQLLKSSKNNPSEILMPTLKQNKIPTQKYSDKRDRDMINDNEDEFPINKKPKIVSEKNDYNNSKSNRNYEQANESCSINYDSVMGQVFASIDADIQNQSKSQSIIKKSQNVIKRQETQILTQQSQVCKTQKPQKSKFTLQSKTDDTLRNIKNVNYEDSENVFSTGKGESEKTSCIVEKAQNQIHGPETQQHIENLLTPGMCRDLASTNEVHVHNDSLDVDCEVMTTPRRDPDDSDKSTFEETPQKASSFTKKQTLRGTNMGHKRQQSAEKITPNAQNPDINDSQVIKNIINISDTLTESNKTTCNITVIEPKPKQTLETPKTIHHFYDQIKHISTPMARKSLNFVPDKKLDVYTEESDRTQITARNTQEKEIMLKAFEPTQQTPFVKPSVSTRTGKIEPQKKLYVAASGLTAAEVRTVEALCVHRQWVFLRQYNTELTHLVVGIDEEGRAQRTVKYMCALAAGKWIISYEWVIACMKTGSGFADPEPYEALDWTGDPGPKLSRVAPRKLFEGITFFCKPPFTVLDENTLKNMLEAAGGKVVNEARQVKVTGDNVALLLAEPENTQENQFIFIAMELSIVPVNYEWVLNCLGNYALSSIRDLLLCPSSLLPTATAQWPAVLLNDYD